MAKSHASFSPPATFFEIMIVRNGKNQNNRSIWPKSVRLMFIDHPYLFKAGNAHSRRIYVGGCFYASVATGIKIKRRNKCRLDYAYVQLYFDKQMVLIRCS